MTKLFENGDDQELDPNKDYFQDLVGEDKRYKTPQEIARSKLEGDRHIKRLEAEMSELRQDLAKRQSTEDLIDQVKKGLVPAAPQGNQPPPVVEEKKGVALDDLDRLLDDRLTQREQEQIRRRNRAEVVTKLQEVFGPDYVSKLKDSAKSLGVGETFLDGLAADNPKAFFKLLEVPTNQPNVRAPNSSVNSQGQANPNTGTKNWAYYQNLRKTNPKVYHSRENAIERHNEAMKQGQAFYS
jgi:hypothetical protein